MVLVGVSCVLGSGPRARWAAGGLHYILVQRPTAKNLAASKLLNRMCPGRVAVSRSSEPHKLFPGSGLVGRRLFY